MPTVHEPLLVNTIGHSAGAVIFGIFLFLLLKDRAGSRFLRGSWLSFAAAGLAFLWDVGSLAALIANARNAREGEALVAISFAVLSLLPAVLLHLALDTANRTLRVLVTAGYVLSAASAVLHLWQFVDPAAQMRQVALVLIPVGFGILTAAAVAVLVLRRIPNSGRNTSRITGAMCLFLFAISFAHFGAVEPNREWSSELIIHHAGIPLALFVLLQDYRFVMLDAFIRFLANVFLAALITFAVIRTGLKLVLVETHSVRNPLYEALLLTALCFLLIGFSILRGGVQRWLTKVIFRRPDLERALQQIRAHLIPGDTEATYLTWAGDRMAEFMNTTQVRVVADSEVPDAMHALDPVFPVPVADQAVLRGDPAFGWAEALVPMRLSQGDTWYALLGRRKGGRRYLSEDLSFLGRVATAIVEQIERLRSTEAQRLVSQAELRALQSQINPHFLFNALNTLYGIIPREAVGARKTVLNLANIFRYFLQSEKTFVPLRDELEIVKAYLDIEHLRLGTRLQTRIEVDDAALPVLIPILSIQPLVENAIKHGIAAKTEPGLLSLVITQRQGVVTISIEDTGGGMKEPRKSHAGAGIGLTNVERRLQLCFGKESGLAIQSGEFGTIVRFSIPLGRTLKTA